VAELLTDWESALMAMSIDDWLELNPCTCHALCTCEQETTLPT
jgi:hypothetical protein